MHRTDSSGLSIYEGPLSALDGVVLLQDTKLASSEATALRPVFLTLTEVPRATTRQGRRRLTAILRVTSGTYDVEARYSTGDAYITGRIARIDLGPDIPAGPSERDTK